MDKSKAITLKDIQELSNKLSVAGGQPDKLYIDKSLYDTLKKVTFDPSHLLKFPKDSWIFDGHNLAEVQRHDLGGLAVKWLTGPYSGKLVAVEANKFIQVPKGSDLKTVRTLFGKP